jgi:hypothetical protein
VISAVLRCMTKRQATLKHLCNMCKNYSKPSLCKCKTVPSTLHGGCAIHGGITRLACACSSTPSSQCSSSCCLAWSCKWLLSSGVHRLLPPCVCICMTFEHLTNACSVYLPRRTNLSVPSSATPARFQVSCFCAGRTPTVHCSTCIVLPDSSFWFACLLAPERVHVAGAQAPCYFRLYWIAEVLCSTVQLRTVPMYRAQ